MAGQVKHKQIFSSIRPDWRLAKLLLNLRTRSTDALLGAVAKVLSDEGIELISSTTFLEPLLAEEGVLTSRTPDADECLNIEYGLGVAQSLAAFDIGQTVVVAAQACVAVEAMEGTDATIDRAGLLMHSLNELSEVADSVHGDAAANPRRATPQPNLYHLPRRSSPAASPSSKSPSPIRTCASTCPSSASPPSKP